MFLSTLHRQLSEYGLHGDIVKLWHGGLGIYQAQSRVYITVTQRSNPQSAAQIQVDAYD